MEHQITIQPYEAKDASSIRALLEKAGLPVSDLSQAKLSNFLVAHDEYRTVVGAVGIETYQDVALLRSLVIKPQWQGKNIGRKMTAAIESYARDHDIEKIYLLTTTADRFFTKLCYEAVDRTTVPDAIAKTEEFQSICPLSAVCMSKYI
ncbi:MAG: arsenic resistance N-acetyltransferase ArsN2 [Desulfobacterales bacterium]|jgi:amino-acid N-acetyltransferase|nr:GNAT family N-acetyltransferase [Desulfobacterales bacterium]